MSTKKKHVCMPSLAIVSADFDAGMTNQAMAEKYDVAISTVSAFLSRNGMSRRVKAFIPPDEAIIECLAAGMTCKQIADLYGGHPDNISRHIRRFGLRNGIAPHTVVATPENKSVRVKPTATKVVNDRGISVPRVPTIHGHFEVRI